MGALPGMTRGALPANVAVVLRPESPTRAISLATADGDIASIEGVTLGGGMIGEFGDWKGQWQRGPSANDSGRLVISVPAASATIVIKLDQTTSGLESVPSNSLREKVQDTYAYLRQQ